MRYKINGFLLSDYLATAVKDKETLRLTQQEIEVLKLFFNSPGNSFVERFNGSYRNEVLSPHLFDSLSQLRELSWAWMLSYNEERPHESLGNIPPSEFKRQFSAATSSYELCT